MAGGKLLVMVFAALLLVASVSAGGNAGAIWTTNGDCGVDTQDANHYAHGDVIYINGNNFDEDSFDWEIKGQPGQASCDPGSVVASGIVDVDDSGAFCFEAYTVAQDDCGEYKAKVDNKQDNYRVEDDEEDVPEFGLIGGALVAAVAGLYLFKRR